MTCKYCDCTTPVKGGHIGKRVSLDREIFLFRSDDPDFLDGRYWYVDKEPLYHHHGHVLDKENRYYKMVAANYCLVCGRFLDTYE